MIFEQLSFFFGGGLVIKASGGNIQRRHQPASRNGWLLTLAGFENLVPGETLCEAFGIDVFAKRTIESFGQGYI